MQANGEDLSKLEYLNLDFKLVDGEVPIFDGLVNINGVEVSKGAFEWRAATFCHKIAQAIED